MSLLLDILYPEANLAGFDQLLTPSTKHSSASRFDGVISIFKYQSPVKETLADLKFNFVSKLAPRLSEIIANRLLTHFPNVIHYWQENNFILVPVPLHPRRQNWRGFNQSELLCQSLSPILKLDYQNLLMRPKNTLVQSSLPKKSRHQNISSAFVLNASNSGNFILVDDVYTTGSTLNSAASVFPENSLLWGLTLAG